MENILHIAVSNNIGWVNIVELISDEPLPELMFTKITEAIVT